MPNPHTFSNLNAPINGIAWLHDTLAAACGDGHLHLTRFGLEKPFAAQVSKHPLLALIPTPEGFVTAAENGDIHLTTPQGETRLLAATKHMFLENIAYFHKKNQILAATGKNVIAVNPDGTTFTFPHTTPTTINGMALSPIGPRLAVSHYNGVAILALDNPSAPPRLLTWKGSHLGLTYSPDGKWLISSMQEQALHLWRLSDTLDLQMRGYPAKITQFSWDNSGTILATNGGGGVPLWDFSTDKGPAGSQARVIADSGAESVLVTSVSLHPRGPFAAIGYSDGLTLLSNIRDESSVLLLKPNTYAVTHLAWATTGLHIATAHSGGLLTITDFSAII